MARRPTEVISHWHHYLEDFSTSALDFYSAVEEAVKSRELPDVKLSRVEFKEGGIGSAKREYLRIERERVVFDLCAAPYGSRGYFFSWWLAQVPGKLSDWLVPVILLGFGFMVLLAMLWAIFGDSCGGILVFLLFFFVGVPGGLLALGAGVRQGAIGDEELVLQIPILGWLYEKVFNPVTYYRLDTALMFQEAVRTSVNEVLEGLFSDKAVRALAPEEWAPRHQML